MKKLTFIFLTILITQCSFAASTWTSMGVPGAKVRTLCVYHGELYAGGDFTGLVKKWNGSTAWVTVGGLTGTRVNVLYVYNDVLYAGGLFPITGSASGNVAKLSGSTWVKVGDGLGGTNSEVRTFGVLGTVPVLHAGGKFTNSSTVTVVNVAKLNSAGTAWSQAGTNAGGPSKCSAGVFALMNYNSELYAGGEGDAPFINKLAVGGQWQDVPAGGPSDGTGVYAMGILKYNTNQGQTTLFIGGKFGSGGGFQKTVAFLNNTSWGTITGFSTGASDQSNCFVSSATSSTAIIYTGGVFSFTGTNPSTNIAKKINGSTVSWDSAGSPAFNGSIRALCFFNGYLVAGGDFSSPGTNVARYATTVDVEEVSDNIIVNSFYPNPLVKEALLKVQTKGDLQQPELRMLDVNGNEILARTSRTAFNHSQNEVEFKIDREGLASGIYYYMVLDEERTIASGKMIVE